MRRSRVRIPRRALLPTEQPDARTDPLRIHRAGQRHARAPEHRRRAVSRRQSDDTAVGDGYDARDGR